LNGKATTPSPKAESGVCCTFCSVAPDYEPAATSRDHPAPADVLAGWLGACTAQNPVDGVDGSGFTPVQRQAIPAAFSATLAALFFKDDVDQPHMPVRLFLASCHIHFCDGFGAPLGPTFRDWHGTNSISCHALYSVAPQVPTQPAYAASRRNNQPSSRQRENLFPIKAGLRGRFRREKTRSCRLEAITQKTFVTAE